MYIWCCDVTMNASTKCQEVNIYIYIYTRIWYIDFKNSICDLAKLDANCYITTTTFILYIPSLIGSELIVISDFRVSWTVPIHVWYVICANIGQFFIFIQNPYYLQCWLASQFGLIVVIALIFQCYYRFYVGLVVIINVFFIGKFQ